LANYLANLPPHLSQERQDHPINGSIRKMGVKPRLPPVWSVAVKGDDDFRIPDARHEAPDVKRIVNCTEINCALQIKNFF
jgi:hypothetical protein